MRESLLKVLRCPDDWERLELDASGPSEDGHIMDGKLWCDVCPAEYPIFQGVPNMLPANRAYVDGEDLAQLQSKTIERFGFEWRHYQDWGWLQDYPDVPDAEEKFSNGGLLEQTRVGFWKKTYFSHEDLGPERLVLDAGCGNGRYSYQAAETGAEVVGVDLGLGVLSAFEHTRSMPNVHIVRGDLFKLPFENATFDRVYSIGVLQHTGNAKAEFSSIVRVARPDSLISLRVYGRGKRSYEILDRMIRIITTQLSIGNQIRFARSTAGVARWMRRGNRRNRIYRRLLNHVNLLPTEHEMYDWWSAPIATHHTLNEVLQWFDMNGISPLRTEPPFDQDPPNWMKRQHHPITALGQRPAN